MSLYYSLAIWYNVRYVRIDAGDNYLQISQLAVYNISGANAARGKSTVASYTYPYGPCNYSASGAVDGVLLAKDFEDCGYEAYVSFATSGAYWQVDLGSEQSVLKVVYYNRADRNLKYRSSTYSLSFFNAASDLIYYSNAFTTELNQSFTANAGESSYYLMECICALFLCVTMYI